MNRQVLLLFALMIMVPMTTVIASTDTVTDSNVTLHEPENYATIKIGEFFPSDDSLENGVIISAALGHMINKNLSIEAALDYIFTDLENDNNYDYGNPDVYIWRIPVTVKFILPLSSQVGLFAGAGLGINFTSVEFGHHRHYDDRYYDDDDSINDVSLGFHCLIGADIKIESNIALTTDLKYTKVERDFDDSYFGQDYSFEVGGTSAFLGAKFLF